MSETAANGAGSCGWGPGAFVAPGGGHAGLCDPWAEAALMPEGTVMAVLTKTIGPAYRLAGAAMAIGPGDEIAGAITSGCVEGDLVLNAAALRRAGGVKHLRYGTGSPFFDLQLPCGGGIEVTLFPLRDRAVLAKLQESRLARQPVGLWLSPAGRLSLVPYGDTGPKGEGFLFGFAPALRHLVFGAGPEALAFARLAQASGAGVALYSHDAATLAAAGALGLSPQAFTAIGDLTDIAVDAATAVTLFYHDHDVEPAILQRLLGQPACYIGAQGSLRAQNLRLERLAEMGVPPEQLARLYGPIGLIPSLRDPHSLAISVLAEITAIWHGQQSVPHPTATPAHSS